MFRTLKSDEIEVRVATVKENFFTLLLYKDARCDMNILDETVGAFNWKREHTRENKNCIVSLWDDKKSQWVSKEDTGAESFTEKEKGLASDSFKRACFNWGIGRELYTAPFIYIPDKTYIKKKYKGDGYTVSERFTVSEIQYENKIIIGLVVTDSKGLEVYRFPRYKKATKKSKNTKTPEEQKTKAIEMILKLDPDLKGLNLEERTLQELKKIYLQAKQLDEPITDKELGGL